jgi:hypothetical protein
LAKVATPSLASSAGDQVSYDFVVTNTGNMTVRGITIVETEFSGTGTLPLAACPVTTLAPGESTTCTATYTVTPADIQAGKVTNRAVARGTLPSGKAVTSAPSTATVATHKISIISGAPGDGAGPDTAEIGLGTGLILIAASAVAGLIARRRRTQRC